MRGDLMDCNVIFFSGGNTFYLLEKIQQSNSAQFFREQINKGIVYIGSSAGSIIAGPDIEITRKIDSSEKAPNLKGTRGIGLIDFIVLPHWGSDDFKDLYLNHRLEHSYNTRSKIILLTDNQYVYVENDRYKIEDVIKPL